MKNLHLIPTDKPSRLVLDDTTQHLMLINKGEALWGNQHIYITNDEEIKEGDWFYCFQNNNVLKCFKKEGRLLNGYHTIYKKIILTTDQDLDGVQAIDDEFLEWFVKNPSCEEVETYSLGVKNQLTGESGHYKYEIIIPKEEPNKTHYLDEIPNTNKEVVLKMFEAAIPKLEPKQETLEEAAKEYAKQYALSTRHISHIGFEDGAKWQQEKMYSEEEVKHIISEALQSALVKVDLEQWFKQFSKLKNG